MEKFIGITQATNKTIMFSHNDTKRFSIPGCKGITTFIMLLGLMLVTTWQETHAYQDSDTSLTELAQGLMVDRSEEVMHVSLEIEDIPLSEALKALTEKIGVGLSYSADISLDQKVSLHLNNVPIHKAIYTLLEGTNLEPVLPPSKDVLVIREKEKTVKKIELQETVTGQVTDAETGEGLPGVNILVQGTTTGTSTNADGEFEVSVSTLNETLIVSYIGYQSQEISINGRIEINISLQSIGVVSEELVVVGYGTQEKVNLTGSVSTIQNREIEGQPATNATSMLQGKMPGVYITQSSGQPGKEEVNFLVRGVGTMNNNQPMVLIDGLEGSMSDVNPNDIESITVLKDAASAAIYGTRAANGVVLVTTKRGSREYSVTYNSHFGIQQPTRLAKPLSSADYARLLNEGSVNEGLSPVYSDDEIRKFETGEDPINYPNTRWLDLLYQGSGFYQNHDLSFSGGDEKTRYRTSLGYFDQKGLIAGTDHKRYNLRVNLDSEITDWFHLGLNSNLRRSDVTEPVSPYGGGLGNITRVTIQTPAAFRNKNEDGTYNIWAGINPISFVEEGGSQMQTNSAINGSVFGEINLMEGLTLHGRGGVNYNVDDDKIHIKEITYADGSGFGPNSVTDFIGRELLTSLQSYVNYQTYIKNHDIKVMVGVSRQVETFEGNTAFRNNFPTNQLTRLDVGSVAGMRNRGNAYEVKIGSYFGRMNYIFNRKYLLEMNLRVDGSSKFARDYRWGAFPSVSAGWRLSEENFMNHIAWIDGLKLRFSLGRLGNHNIGNYLYIPNLSLGANYPIGGTIANGVAQTTAEVADITWETTTEYDVGIDLELFQSQLIMSIDYYDRYTDDILTSIPVSTVFGLPAPVVNAGAMRNKGVELLLNHRNTIGGFFYGLSLNTSFNKNKVERFSNPSIGNTIQREGVSWNSFYGYEHIGVHQTDEAAEVEPSIVGAPVKAGDLKFKDQNGDGVIDGDDRIVLGNSIPEITYGVGLNMGYKNFDLSAFIQGTERVYRTLGLLLWPLWGGGSALEMNLDRTIVQNGKVVQEGTFPRVLTTGHRQHNNQMSSFTVFDASYLRLKNLQVGYTLPTKMVREIGISSARVYVSGQNLLTITKFPKSFDPELLTGQARFSYPQVQFFFVGLNLNF